jgi:ATP-dependent Clp protease ATP-binding subunit ClpA
MPQYFPVDFAKYFRAIKEMLIKSSIQFKEMQLREEAEERLLFPSEQRLKQHPFRQEGTITTVTLAVCRKENGWAPEHHSVVFLVLGSSGVRKTELTIQPAEYFHKKKDNAFICNDISEYQ